LILVITRLTGRGVGVTWEETPQKSLECVWHKTSQVWFTFNFYDIQNADSIKNRSELRTGLKSDNWTTLTGKQLYKQ